jgi:hypothetical protein
MKVARSLLAMTALFISAIPVYAVAADGQGLRSDTVDSNRWRGRLSLTTPAASPWTATDASGSNFRGQRVESAAVLADYYFSSPASPTGFTAGFRASGGVGFGRRGSTWLGKIPLGASRTSSTAFTPSSSQESDSAGFQYVGVGYSGLYPKSGWGFSADLGLMGQSASSAGGAGLNVDSSTQQGVDSLIRQMRLRPVLQVGVSYSF